MQATHEPIYLDKYVFKYLVEQLDGKTPEQICEFYVRNFIFKNHEYLEYLMAEYRLPNDMLKMHEKIIKLAKGVK